MERATAEKAAHWWREQISNESGDRAKIGGDEGDMVTRLAAILASNNRAKPEQLDQFEKELVEILLSEERLLFILDVDYHPDETLHRAALLAGIVDDVFPFKTCMRIEADSIEVRAGYGSSWTTI